jgi:hypothetical protein
MTRSRTHRLVGFALAALLITGGVALAAVPIDDVDLEGGGHTVWEQVSDSTAYCTPAESGAGGYSPVDDGTAGSNNDAFDGGLQAVIGGKAFADDDGNGTKNGQTFKVGPDKVSGVKVRATASALQHSPTLRVLYGFTNSTDHKATPNVILESNLGSDNDGTAIADTASGDKHFGSADRWIVTKDTTKDDGPVTHALYGKHGKGFNAITATPGKPCPPSDYKDGVAVRWGLHIPAHSTRYLMVFAQMHEKSVSDSLDDVKKFNDRNLSDSLLKGVSGKVQNKILNWDL